MSNLYTWGDDLVAMLQDKGDMALVKVLNSSRYKKGAIRNVYWNDLKKQERSKYRHPAKLTKSPFQQDGSCPTCRTPDHMQGIECPGCGFKEWLVLREMSVAILPQDQQDKIGYPVDIIDFRFEDYPEDDDQQKELKQKVGSEHPFYGQFPHSNKFIYFNGRQYGVRIGLPGKTKAIVLPPYWWDYAALYYHDQLIKKPKKARYTDH